MAAVIAPSSHPHHSRTVPVRPAPSRPALQVIAGGRAAARAHARTSRPAPSSVRVAPGVYHRRRLGVALGLLTIAAVVYLAAVGFATVVHGAPAPARGDRSSSGAAASALPAASEAGSSAHRAGGGAQSAGGASGAVHIVRPGETLWSIARSLHPSGDLRPVVDALQRRAGGATLVPGQRLRVDGLTG